MATKNAASLPACVQEAFTHQPELLRNLVQTALQQVLEAEIVAHVGTGRDQRTDSRLGQQQRLQATHALTTRDDAFTLKVVQDREGSSSSTILHRPQRSQKALVLRL